MYHYQEPENINELQGITKYISLLEQWYHKLDNKFIFMLIDGNYGCGKTILAKLYLKYKNYTTMYFDMTYHKNKQHVFNMIKESFNKYDITSYFNINKNKKIAYIIDNISNIFYKNDIVELHNLFINYKSKRPVIFIGKYDKIVNFPKKKIEYMKIYSPTKNILNTIGSNIINKYNLKISNVNLNLFISKCQNDIRKFIILLFNNNINFNLKILTYKKDTDFNLFENFNNLISNYKNISDDYSYENSSITNYLFHQNLFNILLNNFNSKYLIKYSYLFYSYIYKSLQFNNNNIDNYNKQYLYINSSKYISYYYNKKKINKNIDNIKIEYPKYSYINNQRNTYKKYIILFKSFDFYNILNEYNFILFCQSIFYDEINNSYILDKLNKNDIINLKKLVFT